MADATAPDNPPTGAPELAGPATRGRARAAAAGRGAGRGTGLAGPSGGRGAGGAAGPVEPPGGPAFTNNAAQQNPAGQTPAAQAPPAPGQFVFGAQDLQALIAEAAEKAAANALVAAGVTPRGEVRGDNSGNNQGRRDERIEGMRLGGEKPVEASSSVFVYRPAAEGEMSPPTYAESKLQDKGIQAYLNAMGDKSTWDESKADAKPEYAMQWFEGKVHFATLANVDACALIRTHLSRASQQWLQNLLATNTFHFWASDNYSNLRTEFRKRFAMQVRSDSALALEKLVTKGLFQNDLTVEKYSEMFMHQLRLVGSDMLAPPVQCQYFLKGLNLDLKAKCLTDLKGADWTDLQALITFAEVASRQLQAQTRVKRPFLNAIEAEGARRAKQPKKTDFSNPGSAAIDAGRSDYRGNGRQFGGRDGGRGHGGRGNGGRYGGGRFGGGGGRGLPPNRADPRNRHTPVSQCRTRGAVGELSPQQLNDLYDFGACLKCRGSAPPNDGRHIPRECQGRSLRHDSN